MLMYGWMVFVEHAPERYDFAVKVMTAGRLDLIKDRIARQIEPSDRVLDIGCGTGTLGVRCLRRGARVIGLDSSAFMLEQARRNAEQEGLGDRFELVKDSVTQLSRRFEPGSFDVIVSTMALGEFPREYLDYVLTNCHKLLRPGGRLLIADEVWPGGFFARLLYRISIALLWIPQFLLLRRVFFPIDDLRGIIERAGFQVGNVQTWFASSFQLIFARKADEPAAAST